MHCTHIPTSNKDLDRLVDTILFDENVYTSTYLDASLKIPSTSVSPDDLLMENDYTQRSIPEVNCPRQISEYRESFQKKHNKSVEDVNPAKVLFHDYSTKSDKKIQDILKDKERMIEKEMKKYEVLTRLFSKSIQRVCRQRASSAPLVADHLHELQQLISGLRNVSTVDREKALNSIAHFRSALRLSGVQIPRSSV